MRVYIAGPFTKPDPVTNTAAAIDVADELMLAGFAPFIPHAMFGAWDARRPHEYETWMELCLEWLEACEALVRLPGVSPGADREVAHAVKNGIPVYNSVSDFLDGLTRFKPVS